MLLSVLILTFTACGGPELVEPMREMPTLLNIPAEGQERATGDNGIRPGGPITIVVPFLAGGDTDRFARIFAASLSHIFSQPINVINIDGDAGNVGAQYVLAAQPDGYTILFYHTGDMFNNLLNAMPGAVRYTQFALSAVAVHCEANIMVVCESLGLDCATCFLDYARENPGSLRTATVEHSFMHVLLNMAEFAAGFETQIVDVGSARLKAGAILGGHAELTYNNIALFMPYIEEGSLIPLWVASSERNHLLPEVPTLAELGYPAGVLGRSYFFAFPPYTPQEIVEAWSNAVGIAARDPEVLRQMNEMGAMPPYFVPFNEIEAYMADALSTFVGVAP
jgi:tripartite-type tricarboxylate transporter receptor subunit TctC